VLPEFRLTMEYILAIKHASLDNPAAKMSDDALDRLRNPPHDQLTISDPGIRHSISTYLALEHAAEEAYDRVCRSTKRNFSHAAGVENILSYYNVEKIIASYTGVKSIEHDMCPNTCMAYTGPLSRLEACPICNLSRWDQSKLASSHGRNKVGAQKFITIPIGPQLQTMYRHPDSAADMRYFHRRT
ncbi:hypothetical protein F5I97DRAFT_1804750, partial [Phlebopus sp. FC_14]